VQQGATTLGDEEDELDEGEMSENERTQKKDKEAKKVNLLRTKAASSLRGFSRLNMARGVFYHYGGNVSVLHASVLSANFTHSSQLRGVPEIRKLSPVKVCHL
jgi:hypothetical protein